MSKGHWMWGRLLALVVTLACIGCSVHYPCLSGSVREPYRQREDLRLLRSEFERAQREDRPLRARILEGLPRLFPDLSNRIDAPECAPEMISELTKELSRRPLLFDNATLHYLGALGRVGDTTDAMEQKATILLQLATLPDTEVAPYRRDADERGTPPDAEYLRRRAIAALVRSNLYLNDERVRRFLTQKAIQARDPEAQLFFTARHYVASHPKDSAARTTLVEKWLLHSGSALNGPPEPMRFELVLRQLEKLASVPEAHGRLRGILEGVIVKQGALPITKDRPAWQHDVLVLAQMALWDVDDTESSFGSGFFDVPLARRSPIQVYPELFEDPTTLHWSHERVAGRLVDLDAELAQVRDVDLECWLVEQRARYTPTRKRAAWLTHWANDERAPTCAFVEWLRASVVPRASKQRVAAQMIRGAPLGRAHIETPQRKPIAERAQSLRWLLAENLTWLETNETLRSALADDALSEAPAQAWARRSTLRELGMSMTRFEYQRVLNRLVQLDVESNNRERLGRSRRMLEHWIELVRHVDRRSFTNFYTSQFYRALLYAVAEFSPALELDPSAREVLAGEDRDHDLARRLFRMAGGAPGRE